MAIYSRSGESIQSDIVFHPGEILKDELEARGIKQKEFATDIGLPATQLNEIINGKRIVSSELAIILETVLGIDATFWTSMQADFDLAKARSSEKVTSKNESVRLWAHIKKYINVNYLRKVNALEENVEANIEKIKSIFNVSSWDELEAINQNPVAQYFRQSKTSKVNQSNLITWINYVEYLAKQEKVSEYNLEMFPELIAELKVAFLNTNIVENTRNILSKYGIIFLLVKEKLEGVPVDGVAFWSVSNPAIVLTQRYDRIDNFIFTLSHELGHVRFHVKNNGIVFVDDLDQEELHDEDLVEKEANEFASELLINEDLWKSFIRKNHRFDDELIIRFAASIGVLPAVVRGRLCKEKIVSYKKKTDINYKII